ncbi:MAG: valine--tRNA ligase [Planctomycetes bacterium]|nr:valine--tRNA ligase [Planctomycetota bacterium]
MTDTALSKATIPKSYVPSDVEGEILSKWDAANIGHCDANAKGKPFCILIPPPNVTAALHVGHALNGTLQDLLTRWHRMRGFATLWMPGTDHAGIATQSVVEKRLLQQENKKRTDFTREAFVERVQSWKDEYETTILNQLRLLGSSCDWDRTRFTMDDVCAAAVREAFFQLYKDGLIYRGKRLVNWDPVTLTALADDEVEMEEVAGHMYYLRYPLEDGSGFITVATTRPETMLGDTAVAINPNDPRAESLRGKNICLPIVGRIIPIVEDDYVVMQGTDDPKAEFATGFLKVTPAHDPNDWDIGLRHDLEVINIMAPDASISDSHGWEDASEESKQFVGLSRERAREEILSWFSSHDLLEKTRDYEHSVGHSYRSHVPIEPYLSDQWYVRVTDDCLCNEALRSLSKEQYDGTPPPRESGERGGDGQLKFYPERFSRSFQAWHENLRDWCISRQLWWGHRIPVWSKEFPIDEKTNWPCKGDEAIAAQVEVCEADGVHRVYICVSGDNEPIEEALQTAGFTQDKDVLDTWFSSALWPISTMGWPHPEAFDEMKGLLDKFNPSSVLCTAREIITLWVSRMVMFNRYFRDGTLPFYDVYIHPTVQDGFGQKMSKSIGNGVDPRDIISTHGADALRYTMAQLTTGTQDVRLSVDIICPYTGVMFEPKYIVSNGGMQVPAPIQHCPEDATKKMSTVYGILSGEVTDCKETPLAKNSSARFDVGRNFANKYWNGCRFALMNISNPAKTVSMEELQPVDQWMLSRAAVAVQKMDSALHEYKFNAAIEAVYDVLWRDFCDWYLEAIKPTVKDSPAQQRVLLTVVDVISRLLHPICPFVTEAIWLHIRAIESGSVDGIALEASPLIATSQWPDLSGLKLNASTIANFEQLRELVGEIRGARASQKVKPKRKIELLAPSALYSLALDHDVVLSSLAGLSGIQLADSKSNGFAVLVGSETILLSNMLDEAETQEQNERLVEEVAILEKKVAGFKSRLANDSYVQNAPEHVVQETRDMLATCESELSAAKDALA